MSSRRGAARAGAAGREQHDDCSGDEKSHIVRIGPAGAKD
jgi:hypothetical protein